MKKYYYIPSQNKTVSFSVHCESKTQDGKVCYLANDMTSNDEVWLYSDCIEYCKKGNNNNLLYAYEVPEPVNLNPWQYVWGGEIRDKRDRSLCARPYFNRR